MATSKETTNFFGDPITVHYDDGKKTGTSKHDETWYGAPITHHYDDDGKKTGTSKHDETWYGAPITHHDGTVPYIPSTKPVSPTTATATAKETSSTSSRGLVTSDDTPSRPPESHADKIQTTSLLSPRAASSTKTSVFGQYMPDASSRPIPEEASGRIGFLGGLAILGGVFFLVSILFGSAKKEAAAPEDEQEKEREREKKEELRMLLAGKDPIQRTEQDAAQNQTDSRSLEETTSGTNEAEYKELFALLLPPGDGILQPEKLQKK